MRITKTVGQYYFGTGTLAYLDDLVSQCRRTPSDAAVFFVDQYFEGRDLLDRLPARDHDLVVLVDTSAEPTTEAVDAYTRQVREAIDGTPVAVTGIGGGSTLDVSKAVSNMLTNEGSAADYQGWDLVRNPGVFKIGVPTLSGTGAEASRTCVMMNTAKNLKLGMNSDFTVFDRLILDPELTATVPRDQYFFTGMDTYIHCVESLRGRYRHAVADAYSREALNLCREVFLSDDMMSPENREKLMVASFFGGCAIGNSYVGVVHPVSAGLSMVFHSRHCVSNCTVMTVMDDFYPEETAEFRRMAEAQGIDIPSAGARELDDEQYRKLIEATVVHEKPLANALGDGFRSILTDDRLRGLFEQM